MIINNYIPFQIITNMSFMWNFCNLLLLNLFLQAHTSGRSNNSEYCQFDTLHGKCGPDSVILMERADYGRMRSGGCITGEGYTGCRDNVLPYLDAKCSGRRTCEFEVASLSDIAQTCKKDFTSYLEAPYNCVKVETVKQGKCVPLRRLKLHETKGKLSSLVAMETQHGSAQCPWEIVGRSGQTIVLTLLDFSLVKFNENHGWQKGIYGPSNCPIALDVHQAGHSMEKIPLCGSWLGHLSREREIYVSSEQTIQVSFSVMQEGFSVHTLPHFIVNYQVSGCPDLVLPPNAHMTRTHDTATITCTNSRHVWYLTCDGVRWRGEQGNCSHFDPAVGGFKSIFGHSMPVSQGIMIAIIIGVALGVALGTLLLALTLFLRKQKRQRKFHAEMIHEGSVDLQEPAPYYPSLLRHDGATDAQVFHEPWSKQGHLYNAEYTLATTNDGKTPRHHTQSRDLPLVPGPSWPREPAVGHVYESPAPRVPQHTMPDSSMVVSNQTHPLARGTEEGPVYFDLETDKRI